MASLKPIEILINAKDNASKVFDGLNTKLKAVAAAVATYFGINAFQGVIKSAANFEEAMSRVKAATGASGDELAQLRAAAEQAGATTKFSSIEAAAALENLAKAGLNGKDAIAALPAVLNMAQAGGVDLATASEKLTGVIMGMGMKFSESGRAADVLALGANVSRTSIVGLAEAMSYAAPIAKTVGLSLESTVAIVGQFANAGIDASRAGTALNSILAQFTDPASNFRRELIALGITTTNFDDALKQLAATGAKGSGAIQAIGLEAGPALRAALNLGIPALEEIRTKLQNAEGSAAATAKVMGDNLNGSLKGLASIWETVKNTLGTPVLPVVRSGVDELAAALKKAVDDGTITQFGHALSTAFQSAISWVREFLGTVNFQKTTADLQAFATRAGEVFDQIGQFATNAGNIVKLAYGVMSAGTNGVLTGIYGIGSGFSAVAEQVMLGVAKIRDGLSSITFGKLSESFKLAAEDARLAAAGFGDASKAMRVKAEESFQGVANGAEMAGAGFEGLAQAVNQTQKATTAGSYAIDSLAESMRQEAEAAYIAMEAGEKKAQATEKAATTAKEAKDRVAELRKEYAQAVDAQNWQQAAEIQKQINKELSATVVASSSAGKAAAQAANQSAQASEEAKTKLTELRSEYEKAIDLGEVQKAAEIQNQLNKELAATKPASGEAAKSANDMAKAVSDAFVRMGITSTEALKNTAVKYKTDFEIIKNSGIATAEDISNAFASAAEKAIAANKGVAPAWVQAEAALRGYRIETDATGKQTVVSMKDASKAINGVADSHRNAGAAATNHAMSVEELANKYDDAGARAKAAGGQFLAAAKAQQDADTANSSIMNKPGSENQYAWTRLSIMDWFKQAGLDEDVAKKLSGEFVDHEGNVPYLNNAGQIKYGGKYSTLTQALYKAAYPYLFSESGDAKDAVTTPKHDEQPPPQQQVSQSSRSVNLQFNGRSIGDVKTDAAGEDVIDKFIGELERGFAMTGGM